MPKAHVAKQGDTVIKLADQNGFFPPTIWDHPDNADLKQRRKDMNVLYPGDVVVIPDLREKIEKKATEQHHRFRRKGMPAFYRLQIFRHEKPHAQKKFKLEVGAGSNAVVQEGTTDAKGVLSVPIPARATTGQLWIEGDEQPFTVRFGDLDPEDELSGIRQRLEQLGLSCAGEGGPIVGLGTGLALMRFQDRFGLPLTGEADEATIKKLYDFFGTVTEYPRAGASVAPDEEVPSSAWCARAGRRRPER
jgi:hypothetical protein